MILFQKSRALLPLPGNTEQPTRLPSVPPFAMFRRMMTKRMKDGIREIVTPASTS